MNKNRFCDCFKSWIYEKSGLEIKEEFYQAIKDYDLELVYILKKYSDWLANKFCELCKLDRPDYEKEISNILVSFKRYRMDQLRESNN